MRSSLVLLAALLVSSTAAAEPEPDATCIGEYNPDALSNVCYRMSEGTPGGTGHTGSVGIDDTEICIIGSTCVDAVEPTYDPEGGIEYPGVGRPAYPEYYYMEVAGVQISPAPAWMQELADDIGNCVRNDGWDLAFCLVSPECPAPDTPLLPGARDYAFCAAGQ